MTSVSIAWMVVGIVVITVTAVVVICRGVGRAMDSDPDSRDTGPEERGMQS